MILTFIDTETTGLDLFYHEVIDIAYLQVSVIGDSYIEIGRDEARIKPKNIENASQVALKINGYTKNKWKNAIDFSQFLPILKNVINSSDVLVGQNLIFDYRFINKGYDQAEIERPQYKQYVDTKWMADQLVTDKKLKRSSLDYLCEHYKVQAIGRPHTAMTDVLRTFEIYKELIKSTEVTFLSFEKPFDPYGDSNGSEKT